MLGWNGDLSTKTFPLNGRNISSVADPGCLSRIPDPTFFHPGSRIPTVSIPDPGSRILIKEFKYFNPKKAKKWFLSSKKYDPGCSSRIPDPGVKKAPNPGSRIRIRNTEHKGFSSDFLTLSIFFYVVVH
jgi:hypothetical protein